ncbi:hypothetical protein EV175_007603, partial [Coemansia sp. RSA 1933]
REQQTQVSNDGGMSAAPSVFIPLAARLLDTVNASAAVHLPGHQTCVAVDGTGSCVAVGSSEGSVCILSAEFSTGSQSTTSATAAAAVFGSDTGTADTSALAPLLFATGIGDPMDTDIGHTSMAAYASGSTSSSSRWVLQHVLHGHDAAVLDVAIDRDHDVVASAS